MSLRMRQSPFGRHPASAGLGGGDATAFSEDVFAKWNAINGVWLSDNEAFVELKWQC